MMRPGGPVIHSLAKEKSIFDVTGAAIDRQCDIIRNAGADDIMRRCGKYTRDAIGSRWTYIF